MKLMIFIGITVFSTLGSWIGQLMSGGNWFGLWSLLLGTIGSFAGIWAGYQAAKYFEL